MLEAAMQSENSFVTLTYTDKTLPLTTHGLPTLNPRDLQLWLKRLRKAMSPFRLRFYAVGEYGGKTERPHYHAILFGMRPCQNGQTKQDWRGNPIPLECCPSCAMIQDLWALYTKEETGQYRSASLGLVSCGTVTKESSAYVAGYVEKKLTSKTDPTLRGRHPEFSRMSQGIGRDFMWEVASTLLEYDLDLNEDVPTGLRHGAHVMPLGRYLRGKLREYIGRDAKAPQSTIDKIKEELQALRQSAFDNSRSFKAEIVQAGNQRVLNMEKRAEIFKTKKERLK